jgi:hypothetical protein
MVHKTGSSMACDLPWMAWSSWTTTGRIQLFNSFQMDTGSHQAPYGSSDGDNGGPWQLIKTEYRGITPGHYTGWFANGQYFDGNFLPGGASGGFTPPQGPVLASGLDMISKGTTLMSRALPTNPSSSLAQFLGELHEGLPHIFGSSLLRDRTDFLRGSGSEYLNAEFGWAPMVSDVRKFAHAVKHSHEILRQFHKDSGKKIRRRRAFPDEISEAEFHGGIFPLGGLNTWLIGDIYWTNTVKCWFSGAFKYYVPVSDTVAGKFERFAADADKLLGVRLTPDVLWELTPWSWAYDWFTNTGDIMKNISQLGHDGLVMQYGYLMRSSEQLERRSASMGGSNSTLEIYTATKQRLPATPYGFGVDMGGLSNTQIAILAALGISRR